LIVEQPFNYLYYTTVAGIVKRAFAFFRKEKKIACFFRLCYDYRMKQFPKRDKTGCNRDAAVGVPHGLLARSQKPSP
jgi:hypothetical protein